MQSQNSEVNFAERDGAQLIVVTDSKLTENIYKKKCLFKPCKSPYGCRKFWHKPCLTLDPGFVGQLWPTVLAVGLTEIFLGVSLIVVVTAFREKYDKLYSNDAGEIIRLVSILGLLVLALCGAMLVMSLIMDNRKIMWIRIMTSTGWAGYVVTLSILKMHIALLANEPDASTLKNLSVLLSDAGMIELFTLLGAVFHFFGDIAVFTYYNIRFLQPELFSGQVEHI